MCFSAQASLIAFVAGIASAIMSYSVGKPDFKVVGLFFVFVSLMQIVDYLLWKHQTCDSYNKMVSFVGMILNHLQPVILFALLWYFKRPTDIRVLLVYLLFIVPYSFQKFGCAIKGRESHLVWDWTQQNYNRIVYGVFVVSMALIAYKGLGTIPGLAVLVSLLLSKIVYPTTHSTASLWCFFVVLGPLGYMTLKNQELR